MNTSFEIEIGDQRLTYSGPRDVAVKVLDVVLADARAQSATLLREREEIVDQLKAIRRELRAIDRAA